MRLITILLVMTLIVTALGIGCSSLDTSCQDAKDAPYGSAIVIKPESFTVTEPHDYWRTEFFTISVTDKDTNPLNNIRITFFFPYAVPDTHGYVQLYDGATPVNSPFSTCTNANGVYHLRFDYYGAAAFLGDLRVESGATAFMTAAISVNQ